MMRYGLYFFTGLWMFALGVMVGRGSSPVTFDTQGFQNRLKTIANAHDANKEREQDVDLKFYKVLDTPAGLEKNVMQNSEIVPATAPSSHIAAHTLIGKDGTPIKLGKKLQTLNAELLAAYQDALPPSRGSQALSQKIQVSHLQPSKQKTVKASNATYTIQVAAFKTARDAEIEMARLNKKGIIVYQVIGKNGDTTWHRLRTGSYPNYTSAKAALATLKDAHIEGMIMKKE